MFHMKGKFLSITLAALLCLGSSLLQARAETPQFKHDDSEDLRADSENFRKALHELLPMFKTCVSCGREDNEEQIAKLEKKLDGLSKEELASVARSFDVPRFISLVEKLKTDTAASGEKADTATSKGESVALAPLKSPPEPPGYEDICSPPRKSARGYIGFILVVGALEEAENAAFILCETGAPIPFEGIATPACIAALFVESVAILGRSTLSAFLICEASIDSAEIEAGWKNTTNIHNDLETYNEKINQRLDTIEESINDINSQLQKILDLLYTPQVKQSTGDCP